MEDNDQVLEFERMRLAKLQLTRKIPGNQAHIVDSVDRLNISEGDNLTKFFFCVGIFLVFMACFLVDRLAFSSTECLHYLMDVLNNGSIVGDKSRPSETNYDQDRYTLDPRSWFHHNHCSICISIPVTVDQSRCSRHCN